MPSNGVLSQPQVNEIRDKTLNNHKTIAGIICGNTKMKEATIKRLFSQGQTKNGRFALKNGIVNKVQPPQIPQNASI